MAAGKNFAGWVSGEFVEAAQKRVDKAFGGNASAYVAHLIEQDIGVKKIDIADDKQIVTALAARFKSSLEDALRHQLLLNSKGKPVNQPLVIDHFLGALSRALEGNLDPEQPFEVVTKQQIQELGQVQEGQLDKIAQRFFQLQQQSQKPAPYPKQKGK